MSDSARRDVGRLIKAPAHHLPGLDDAQKKARLARTSYADFLVKMAGCDAGVPPFFQARPHSLYGLGIDAVSALDAWGIGLPGFAGMRLEPTAGPGMGLDARPGRRSPFLHFPDGNATIARLLVRRLIPAVPAGRPWKTWSRRARLRRLDARRDRFGFGSTVRRCAPATRRPRERNEVEVDYVRAAKLDGARPHCVLACWNG